MAAVDAPVIAGSGPLAALARLTPSGRANVPIAWSLYDFANTIFSYAVVSNAIGVWLTDGARFDQDGGQLVQTLTVIASVGLNALVSPILGALSDRGGRRLPFLLVFTVLTIIPCAFIGFSPPVIGAVLFAISNFAYQAALIYYDSTLAEVSNPSTRGRLSGIGVAVGYCGTIFIGVLLIVLVSAGLITHDDYFWVAAIGYGVFAIPIFVFVREPRSHAPPLTLPEIVQSFTQLRRTIEHTALVPGLRRFLLGRFFYSDAVNTVIVVLAVIAIRAMGFSDAEFLQLTIVLTIVAITASAVWGRLVDRFGPRRVLLWVLASWGGGLILGAIALGLPRSAAGTVLFIAAGAIVGSGLGGVQVADRVFMTRLSPPERLGEFFGLYGLVGKGSQVVGQAVYGLTVAGLFGSLGNGAYQVAILTLLVTMIIGYQLIRPVRDGWQEPGHVEPGQVEPGPALATRGATGDQSP